MLVKVQLYLSEHRLKLIERDCVIPVLINLWQQVLNCLSRFLEREVDFVKVLLFQPNRIVRNSTSSDPPAWPNLTFFNVKLLFVFVEDLEETLDVNTSLLFLVEVINEFLNFVL